MESIQGLKKRVKSVKNIKQVTKTMELVAALKMRKAQEIAIDSRPYALASLDLLASISSLKTGLPIMFKSRKEIKSVLYVVVSSDKGLAGAFNSSVFKKLETHIEKHEEKYKNENKIFLAIGEKASQYILRRKFNMIKKFVQAGDYALPEQIKPISDFIAEGYIKGEWDRVVVISTYFRTALKQEALVRRVLPVDFGHVKDIIRKITPESGKFSEIIKVHKIDFLSEKKKIEYLIEPSSEEVLQKLGEHLFFMQMYHLILEANASEHSARRMAMKTASDNAEDLSEKLNIQYNKSRQASITSQIIEIVSGAEALN